jgi:selenoprotein W-related protein
LAESIIEQFKVPVNSPHPIKRIEMVPSGQGRFDVEVDGKILFSKYDAGRHAEPAEIVEKLKAILNA